MNMETTIYLSQLFGLFLAIVGAAVLYRKQYYVPVIGAFVEERLSRMLMGMLELAAGLSIVLAHTDWSSPAASTITTIGYLLAIEGTMYLLLPDKAMGWVIRTFNVKAWYIVGGTLSILLGAYLCFFGFGLF